MATTTNITPINNRVFSRRHLRGWIVAALLAVLLILDTGWLLEIIFIGAPGHAAQLQDDVPPRHVLLNVAFAGAVILVASPRARGFTLKAGRAIRVRVALLFHGGRGRASQPTSGALRPVDESAGEAVAFVALGVAEPSVDSDTDAA